MQMPKGPRSRFDFYSAEWLILGRRRMKIMVGILVAMHAPVAGAALFGPMLGMLYGAFSGVFLARAGRLLVLARQTRLMPGARQAV
jgi:hypothetical protein